MLYHYIKMIIRSQSGLLVAGDFIRYTYTAAFGFVWSIWSLLTLIAVALAQNNPLLILRIFYAYIVTFSVAMAVSFLAWRKYKGFYKNTYRA